MKSLKENLGIGVIITLGVIFFLKYRINRNLDLGLILIIGFAVGFFVSFFETFRDYSQSYLKIRYPYQRFYASMRVFYFSILQHFHLRWIIHRKKMLPKKLVHFLKESTSRNFLESEGGSWRFRHRILQNYLIAHWKDKYAGEDDNQQIRELLGRFYSDALQAEVKVVFPND